MTTYLHYDGGRQVPMAHLCPVCKEPMHDDFPATMVAPQYYRKAGTMWCGRCLAAHKLGTPQPWPGMSIYRTAECLQHQTSYGNGPLARLPWGDWVNIAELVAVITRPR